MKDQPPKCPPDSWQMAMDSQQVDAAAHALKLAINDALKAQGLPPLKTLAIIAHAPNDDSVFSTGCRCPGCLERMLQALGEAFGGKVSTMSAVNSGSRSKRGHH